MFYKLRDKERSKGSAYVFNLIFSPPLCVFYKLQDKERSKESAYVFNLIFSNPQKITCIIFANLFGPYFLPPQSHSYGYAPSSGENMTLKMSFKSDATYYFHIT